MLHKITPGQTPAIELKRREFIQLLAAGAGATALGLRPAFAKSEPNRGGMLRIALDSQSTNDTFDPARGVYSGDFIRFASVYNYLTRYDGTDVRPELALSFDHNSDLTQWTFTLRKGVVFHDGSPLTPQDVAFSIMRHKEKKVASTVKTLVQHITEVVADGPDKVVVKTSRPDADLPVLLSLFQFGIVKNGTYDFSDPNPVGTGAFTVDEFSPGMRTVCKRYDNYWKDGQPYIDGFELFSILDPVARANAVLSGDVHMVKSVSGSSIKEVKSSDVARIMVTNAPRYTAFQAAVDIPPGDRKHLGLALACLIDRQRIHDVVLRGYGPIANDNPILPGTPYYDDSLPQRDLDIDKARFHLQKAGITNQRIDLQVSEAAAFSVDMGQILQRGAIKAGMNLKLQRQPANSYWSAIAGKRALFATTFNPWGTPGMFLGLTWKTGAAWNFSHYSNTDLDKMINEVQSTLDKSRRKEAYSGIQKTIRESGAIVLPCFINYVDGISKKVQGLTPVPTKGLGGLHFTDEVWLED